MSEKQTEPIGIKDQSSPENQKEVDAASELFDKTMMNLKFNSPKNHEILKRTDNDTLRFVFIMGFVKAMEEVRKKEKGTLHWLLENIIKSNDLELHMVMEDITLGEDVIVQAKLDDVQRIIKRVLK